MLPDSNVWLALALSQHAYHGAVGVWLSSLPPDTRLVMCRSTQQSLLRLLTTKAVFAAFGARPLSNSAAATFYRTLIADRRVVWCDEPPGLDAVWLHWSSHPQASPKLWMDAYLAAFAYAGNLRLVTIDRAFRQFSELEVTILDKPT